MTTLANAAELAVVVAAVVGAVVAVVTLCYRIGRDKTRRQGRRAGEQAAVRVWIQGDSIAVRNDGPGAATDVSVFLDDLAISDHPDVVDAELPIARLAANAFKKFLYETHLGSVYPKTIRVTWTDGGGARKYETSL